MNACDHYQELISRLVDGELSREEHEALMAHLNTCSRCNAMYAVFHDLSDLLAEDPAPLPAGLHENIMAGVRRSEIMKKNRRMRRIGLRTALTAAACAVLVLFAAAGFDPGRRADSVSIRNRQDAEQLLPTPMPSAAPTPQPAPTSAPTANAGGGSYPAPDSGAAFPYTTAQPGISEPAYDPYDYHSDNNIDDDRYVKYDDTGTAAWTPAPVVTAAPVWTPEPVWTSEPIWTPEPVVTAAPEEDTGFLSALMTDFAQAEPAQIEAAPAQVETEPEAAETGIRPEAEAAPAAVEETAAEEAAVETPAAARRIRSAAPALRAEAVESPAAETQDETEGMYSVEPASITDDTEPEIAMYSVEPEPVTDMDAETEESPAAFSLFSNMINIFEAPAETLTEAKLTVPNSIEAALDGLTLPEESEEPVHSGMPLDVSEAPAEAMESPAPAEESVTVYGSSLRGRLLAMIGSSEDSLPAEAELTRLVHVTFIPEDAYGSEERMDVHIYGDFVYCAFYPVEGGSRICRADCSLRELDAFFTECEALSAAAPSPSAAPTPDPYAEGEAAGEDAKNE